MMNHILVPLDGSPLAECVLPHVIAIAHVYSASVVLLRVLEPNRVEAWQSTDPLGWQIGRTEAGLYIDNVLVKLQDEGLNAEKVLLEGSAADRIVEYAQSQSIDLIFLTDHGQSGLDPWGISSTTHKVAYSAATSLMLIRANDSIADQLPGGLYRHILVPLDGSLRAESILPVVISLAGYHRSKVHLAHCIGKPEMARRTPLTSDDADLSSQIVERNRDEASQYLEEIRSRLLAQDLEVETHLVVGETSAAILHDLTEQLGIDLVMVNAHGYTGNARWPYGSLVQHLMSYGKTPLLIMQDLPNKTPLTQSDIAVREHSGK